MTAARNISVKGVWCTCSEKMHPQPKKQLVIVMREGDLALEFTCTTTGSRTWVLINKEKALMLVGMNVRNDSGTHLRP